MTELVVLADNKGLPAGTADKATIHTTETPLHFAFSAYLLDDAGRVLLSRRALSKLTWPGVWTNSYCGHPGPGESNEAAVVRRGLEEMGIPAAALGEVETVLPEFRYRAVDSSGIVENEICPVFVVRISDPALLNPNPGEIDSHDWAAPQQLFDAVDAAPFAFSPWLVEELADPRLRERLLAG